jgi:3-vinyl bacteriochlorophyllide hydratase
VTTYIYTPEQRARRDASPWTIVQAVLAPLQFLVFLVSVVLVTRTMTTGEGYGLALASVGLKTLLLYAIMLTGCIWEKQVFGKYLFAAPFFWEDAVGMVVMALHTAVLFAWFTRALEPTALMQLALVAYASYAINAAQFILKLKAARAMPRPLDPQVQP